jgi:hypothetical protein
MTMVACSAWDQTAPSHATKDAGNAPSVPTPASGAGGGAVVMTTAGAGGSSAPSGAGGADQAGSAGSDAIDSDAAAMDEVVVVEPPTPPSVCYTLTPAEPMIFDFHDTGQTANISFGDFAGGFSGFSFAYGAGITSDVTQGTWHLTGMVGDYSGFGLGFNYDNQHDVDASAFSGVEFTIKGNAGASNAVTLAVQNGPDVGPSSSACAKCTGGCIDPSKTFPVTAAGTKVSLKWTDFQGGTPQQGVDPKQLTGLLWYFAWTGQGSAYAVDVTVDDISFIPSGGADAAAE